jgi:hypothetical protein
MGLQAMEGGNPYPLYLYHRDHNEPVRVDTIAEETALKNQGWQRGYINKEYPKLCYGKRCMNKEDEIAAKRAWRRGQERPGLNAALGRKETEIRTEPKEKVIEPEGIIAEPIEKPAQDIVVKKERHDPDADDQIPSEKPVEKQNPEMPFHCAICGMGFESPGAKGAHAKHMGHKKPKG